MLMVQVVSRALDSYANLLLQSSYQLKYIYSSHASWHHIYILLVFHQEDSPYQYTSNIQVTDQPSNL